MMLNWQSLPSPPVCASGDQSVPAPPERDHASWTPHPKRRPALHPHPATGASGQCCVTSGVKVIATINGAPKSQPAAPCLFPARDGRN